MTLGGTQQEQQQQQKQVGLVSIQFERVKDSWLLLFNQLSLVWRGWSAVLSQPLLLLKVLSEREEKKTLQFQNQNLDLNLNI